MAGCATAARVPVPARFWGSGETACDGGQSATFVPVLLLRGSLPTGARSAIPFFGLCVSGQSGKSDGAVGGAMRLRAENLAGEGNSTGDITHLEARPSISLFLRYVNTYFRFLFVAARICTIPSGLLPYTVRPALPPSPSKSILPWPRISFCSSAASGSHKTAYVKAFTVASLLGISLHRCHARAGPRPGNIPKTGATTSAKTRAPGSAIQDSRRASIPSINSLPDPATRTRRRPSHVERAHRPERSGAFRSPQLSAHRS